MEDICNILKHPESLEKAKIPSSDSDLLTTFNPSQRLAIYEHVVTATKDSVVSLPLNEIDMVFE
jgi:hypothetical protein